MSYTNSQVFFYFTDYFIQTELWYDITILKDDTEPLLVLTPLPDVYN